MSEQKDFDRYLRGEYYPGAPKTPWRIAMEADFARRGVSFDSRPVPQKRVIVKAPAPKNPVCRITRVPKVVAPAPICPCGVVLKRHNKSGLCGPCYDRRRCDLRKEGRRKCAVPDCPKRLRSDSKWDKCREHTRIQRSKEWNQNWKQKVLSQKVAA